MSFLAPLTAIIAAAITVPALVSLYFLKLRRKPMAVPTTLLWAKSIQDLQVNAPFQRIRNNLLLWLQLLLLGLLLLAMARPTQRAEVTPGSRLVILIDRSASMNTLDAEGGVSRLAHAKDAALGLIDSLDLSATGGVMVVAFAERADVLQAFTNDRGRLRAAVRAIDPTDQPSRLEPAVGLIAPHAAAAAAGQDAAGLSVHVFSDGKLSAGQRDDLALPGTRVLYSRLGDADTANVGIVAASARRDDQQPDRVNVFARLIHTGPAPTTTNVTLRIAGRAIRTKAVDLPAATEQQPGDATVSFSFTRRGEAELELIQDRPDPLASDDTARLALLPTPRQSVLLVSRDNPYLRQAIHAAGAQRLEVVDPARYEQLTPGSLGDGGAALAGYDLIVFDRYTPRAVPPVSSLSFGSAPPVPGLSIRPAAPDAPELQGVLTWQRDHPLMRYVVLDDVTLRRPGRLIVPVGAKVLAVGAAGPLIAELPPALSRNSADDAQTPTARHLAVAFDLLDSRWPHHWSFQVFMVNVLQNLGVDRALASGEAAVAYHTGQIATVPVPPGQSSIAYQGPARIAAAARQGQAILPAMPLAGWYDAVGDAAGPGRQRLPVSVLDPEESDVRSSASLNLAGSAGQIAGEQADVRREVWTWFAWAALGLLMVEWLVYTGRMRV